jgi:hypothetical protein
VIAWLLAVLILFSTFPAAAQTVVATGVSEDATDAASEAKIARDPQGSVHLAFVKPAGGFDQIHVASSMDNGRTWRTRQVTSLRVQSRYPTLAAGPDSRLHLAWTTYEPIGHIYYSRFDGNRWSVPVKISPGNAYAGVPAIAVDPRGDPHVVWYGIRDQAPQVTTRHGSIYEILYSGRSGARWSAAVVISPGIPDSINPSLAADGSGVLHSAWYQFDIEAYQVQYARRLREWEPPRQVSSGRADAFGVALAVRKDGTAYVVWERRGAPDIRIYFAERRDQWSGQQAVSPEGRPAFNPSVAVDDRGRVYVVWESEGQLFLRRRDRQWLGTERVASEGKNTQPIVAAHGDTVDLMWTQEVGGERRIQFATIGGSGGPPAPRGGSTLAGLIIAALALLLLWQWRRRARVTGS